MSVMSSLSIEKTREECFVLVGRVNCFGVILIRNCNFYPSPHITGLDWWEELFLKHELSKF